MGRPPCCDKVGIKKGPWTPEEDIILVSYIQDHGPGNWRSVPTNTGLLRCSKSCRLRWTNYLRPGIKRGNFTPHEEGMIIHLQALLGNKWAAIASYLPQRTDNDIKNYWNTHLKKKLKKFQASLDPNNNMSSADSITTTTPLFVSAKSSFCDSSGNNSSSQTSSTYASSTENISRLLEGWMRSSPKIKSGGSKTRDNLDHSVKAEEEILGGNGLISNDDFESILSFDNFNNISCWDKSWGYSIPKGSQMFATDEKPAINVTPQLDHKIKQKSDNSNPPFSVLETWLLDETEAGQVEEIIGMSEIF